MPEEGVTANPNIIEAKNGFYDTLVGAGHYDAQRMAEKVWASPSTSKLRASGSRNIQAAITPTAHWMGFSSCWESTA
jgi:hypothetical protein